MLLFKTLNKNENSFNFKISCIKYYTDVKLKYNIPIKKINIMSNNPTHINNLTLIKKKKTKELINSK